MKVFLATQVVSATVIRLIDMHVDKCGGNEKYQPIRSLIEKIDRLVDLSHQRIKCHGWLLLKDQEIGNFKGAAPRHLL